MASCQMSVTILVADDDEDDRLLIKEAFAGNCPCIKLEFAEDGVELLEQLQNNPKRPSLILLDLNMPRMGGIEALKHIKSDNELKDIPVLVFTTSDDQKVLSESYCAGANSFITKPNTFERLSDMVTVVSQYWCKVVSLPRSECPAK